MEIPEDVQIEEVDNRLSPWNREDRGDIRVVDCLQTVYDP